MGMLCNSELQTMLCYTLLIPKGQFNYELTTKAPLDDHKDTLKHITF